MPSARDFEENRPAQIHILSGGISARAPTWNLSHRGLSVLTAMARHK